jgi:hypothetical protein
MKYMMSTKELARLAVIKSAIDGACTAKQVARKLGISTRWAKALKKAVREQGDGAVIHGNAGRHPVNATDEGIRKRIIALKKSDKYQKARLYPLQGTAGGVRADKNQLYRSVLYS